MYIIILLLTMILLSRTVGIYNRDTILNPLKNNQNNKVKVIIKKKTEYISYNISTKNY